MRAKTYLLTALLAFVASVSGSDIVARILVAGSDARTAVAGHLDWLANSPLAVALLAAPFAGTALICIALGTRSPRAAAILHIVAIAAAVIAMTGRAHRPERRLSPG